MIKSVFLVITILLLFNSCGSKTTTAPIIKQTPIKVPTWITNSPSRDSENSMYGIGIDIDRTSAIKDALNDIVSKLGTTIESSFEINQEIRGSYSKSLTKNQIKSSVSKIKINNYQVIKSHRINYNQFAVLVKIDKQKLIVGLKDNLDIQKKYINQRYISGANADILARYNNKKDLAIKSKKLISEIFVIANLDRNFNKGENLDFVNNIQKDFLDESKKLKFFVSGSSQSIFFVDIIKNYLTENEYNIASSKEDAIQIKIDTTDYISRASAINIAVLTVKVSVYDKLKLIGGKSMTVKERYSGSHITVYKNASIHLYEKIKQQGIYEVLGINLNNNKIP